MSKSEPDSTSTPATKAPQESASATPLPKAREYWAFISYSHRDKVWADWLHRRLETYRVPKKLIGTPNRTGQVPKRLYPIFRDREELPTSANLGSVISRALETSRYLVVICSPRSAASQWVNQEILAFKALGKADRVLALIVDGEPNASGKPGQEALECFPEALRYEINPDGTLSGQPAEPVAGDARPFADGKRNALFKLLAGLLGVDYAILNDREHKRRLRRALIGTSLVFALVAGALGIWAVQEQRRLRDLQAEHQKTLEQRDRALRNLAGIYQHQAEQALAENRNGPALLHLTNSLESFDTLGARVSTGFALPGLVPELARWPLHDSAIQAMRVVAHEGAQLLVSAAMRGPLRVLRLRDLEPIADFEPAPWVSALTSDSAGRIIAAGMDGVRLLDPASGENQLLPELSNPGLMYRLSPDGTLAAAFDPTKGLIRLLSIPDGKVLAELTPEPLDWKPSGTMRFSADGTKLAAGGTEGRVQVWSTAVPAEEKAADEAENASGNAGEVENAPETTTKTGADGTTAASAQAKAPVAVFTGLESSISALAFSADGRMLAAGEGQFLGGSGRVEILVWELDKEAKAPPSPQPLARPKSASPRPLARLKGHEQQINQLAFSQDGRLLASSSDADAQLRLWDVGAFNPELFEDPRFEFQPLVAMPQLQPIKAMEFASGGNLLVLGDSAGYARLLDTGAVTGPRQPTSDPFKLIAAAAAANRLALLQPGGVIKVLALQPSGLDKAGQGPREQTSPARSNGAASPASHGQPKLVRQNSLEIASLGVDPMTSALAISDDGTEIAWAADDRLFIQPIPAHSLNGENPTPTTAPAPDSDSGSTGNDARLPETADTAASQREAPSSRTAKAPSAGFAIQGPVQALAFSPAVSPAVSSGSSAGSSAAPLSAPLSAASSANQLMAQAGPGVLRLYERATGALRASWKHPAGRAANMQAVSFSQDGRFLALTTTAGPVVLATADLTTQTIDTQGQGVFGLAFAPATGESPAALLAACQDGLVRRWRLGDWQPLEPLRGFEQLVATLAASADGQLYAATSGASLQVWSAADGSLLHREQTNDIAIDALHLLDNGGMLSWSSSYLNRLSTADLNPGPLPPLLENLRRHVELGLPYRLDRNGEPIPRAPAELAEKRLQAVIDDQFPWPLARAGLSQAALQRILTLTRPRASQSVLPELHGNQAAPHVE